MICNKIIEDNTLPLYEVHEVSVEEALRLLRPERENEPETLISRAGRRLQLTGVRQRLQ